MEANARRVTLRRLDPADIDGLEELYRSLPPSDRYQRFFTEAPPPRRTVERYVALLDQRGAGVVAVTEDGTIVGEAGYFRLPGGDGEFGITVAPEWRGLGRLLLGSIVDHASGAGVPSLQGDVLAENRAMLALAAKRGFALIHSDDYTVLRIALGTVSPVPGWPSDAAGPRLLVETSGWSWRVASLAAAAGFDVMCCRGPSSLPAGRCPVLHGERCPLVEGAHAVVVALRPEDRCRGALTPIHRFCNPDLPVFLQEGAGEERPAWIPDGVGTFGAGAAPARVVAQLEQAVTSSR